MKVKFTASVSAGYSRYETGKTYDLADAKAARFIEAGYAKKVVSRKTKRKKEDED